MGRPGGGLRPAVKKGVCSPCFLLRPALVAARSAPPTFLTHILNSTPMTRHSKRRISSAVGYTEFLSICTARCRPTHYRARLRIVIEGCCLSRGFSGLVVHAWHHHRKSAYSGVKKLSVRLSLSARAPWLDNNLRSDFSVGSINKGGSTTV